MDAESFLVFPPRSEVGIDSKEEHENAKAILLEMGEYFQIQVGALLPLTPRVAQQWWG